MTAVQTAECRPCVSQPASRSAKIKCCDLCHGSRFERIAQADRDGQPLDTVVCLRCGLVSHATIPSEATLTEFYANHYRQEYHGEYTPSDRRVLRAWKNGRRIVRQLTPWLDREASVFEVGAGIGCNVKAFEIAGFDASGIDPGIGFQRFAATKIHAKVEDANLFDLPRDPAYDLVLLVHVIEHFRSPRSALELIHRIVKPGGQVYIECPNLFAPFTRRARLFHFAHVHNFTPFSLTMLANRCGFEMVRQLSAEDSPNLQMLLKRVGQGRMRIDPHAYSQTMEALDRSRKSAYYMRRSYILRRLKQLAGYCAEHITARRSVARLLAECSETRKQGTSVATAVLENGRRWQHRVAIDSTSRSLTQLTHSALLENS